MLQIFALVASIGLIVLGCKGLFGDGLALSKNTTLKGSSAKVVGVCCILGGIGLIPAFFLLIILLSGPPR